MSAGRTVLTGGLVIDGSGGEPFTGDVLLTGETIEAVVRGRAAEDYADREVIDCAGRIVAPGFVDIHTHSDLTLLAYPGNESRVTQGVTTEVVGNCGMSPAPIGADRRGLAGVIATIDVVPDLEWSWEDASGWLDALEATPTATNVLAQVGHGSARFVAAGASARRLTTAELAVLEREVESAFAAGCSGVSLGLMYPPGEGADDDELVRVARLAAMHDATVSVHLRDYTGDRLMGAVDEVLAMAERSGARLQISHLRRVGDEGSFARVIERITEARNRIDVSADSYPYVAGHTTLTQLLPPALRGQGPDAVADACRHIPDDVVGDLRAAGWSPADIIVMKAAANPEFVGVCAAEIEGDPWRVLVDLLAQNGGLVDVAVNSGRWDDVDLSMTTDWISIASDGTALAPSHCSSVPHPRSWGAFPAAYRRMRTLGVSSADAVRRMSSQPAARFGLDRTLRPGRPADVVVFEEHALQAAADFAQPSRPATGVHHVLVNGAFALRDGALTASRTGKLRRRGHHG